MLGVFLSFSALAEGSERGRASAKAITVYKSPTCGCCAAWVDYLGDQGFRVSVIDRLDLRDIKEQYGIKTHLRSCHTGVVDGYAIEGHVPAGDIWRLLKERPAAAGLSAPGMPKMSPGMHSIEPKGYDVLLFDDTGKATVFSRY